MLTALLAQTGAQVPGGAGQGGGLPPLQLPEVRYLAISPILALTVGALVLLTISSLLGRKPGRGFYAWFTVLTSAVALVFSAILWNDVRDRGGSTAYAGAVAIDGFAVFFFVLLAGVTAIGALIADAYLRREELDGPEYYVLSMLSASGGMLMAAANDLLVLFLGLEILSLALYVLAALHRRRAESGEAGLKYFVLGAFSSAFFLYGIALVYGATGSTNMATIAQFLAENVLVRSGVLLAGVVLILVGLGFKVAAVPFHSWTPDVYQGAPTPSTAFMAAAAKAAGFAGLLRIFVSAFGIIEADWSPLIWALAALTLLVGSALAVVQTDVKRMLAYSSISHAGYVLLGLEAGSDGGVAGSLFYLLAYAFIVLGSFAIVTLVGRGGDRAHALESYKGLSARRPALALTFTVFLLAQAGVPLTTGFLAKFEVIRAAVEAESYVLAVLAMLCAVIGAFAYLRLVMYMWAPAEGDESTEPAEGGRATLPTGAAVALAFTVAFTLVVGILPGPVLDFARDAHLLF